MQHRTITPRELRATLFDIQDQALTIAELRRLLFDSDDQDRAFTLSAMAEHINTLEAASRPVKQAERC